MHRDTQTFDLTWEMLHTRVICLCTDTFSWYVMSSKRKTTRKSFVYLPKFGSVFSGAHVPLHALLFITHGLTHTPFTSKHIPRLTYTFPGVVLAGESSNGLEQACFLVQVKIWPGRKAAAIRSLPRCLWSGPVWTSTCWESFTLDTLFRALWTLWRGGGTLC